MTLASDRFTEAARGVSRSSGRVVRREDGRRSGDSGSRGPSRLLSVEILNMGVTRCHRVVIRFCSRVLRLLRERVVLARLVRMELRFFYVVSLYRPSM